jgi:hypothetical protein
VDTWRSLGAITAPIIDKLSPVPFEVMLHHSLAKAVRLEAAKSGNKPETLIAEAVRFYLGDAA